MPLESNDPIAVADIKAACRRRHLDAAAVAAILDDYRDRGPHLLAAAVLVHAMTLPPHDPAAHSRRSARAGADLYVSMRLAAPAAGRMVPGPDHDWPLDVARACDRMSMAPVDWSYVMGRLAGEGWRPVVAWVELAIGDPAIRPSLSPGAAVRKGCAGYARACLWVRDHPGASVHLETYGAIGRQWQAGPDEAPMVLSLTITEPPPCATASPSPSLSA